MLKQATQVCLKSVSTGLLLCIFYLSVFNTFSSIELLSLSLSRYSVSLPVPVSKGALFYLLSDLIGCLL